MEQTPTLPPPPMVGNPAGPIAAPLPGRLAAALLAAALALGIAGDLLLRATPWGINAPAWVALLGLAAFALSRLPVPSPPGLRGGRWLAVAFVAALGLALRDSPVLVALNVLAALFALAMVAFRTETGTVRRSGIVEYAVNGALTAGYSTFGLGVVLARVAWRELLAGGRVQTLRATGVGFAVTIPLVALFGGLFASADASFSDLLTDAVVVDPAVAASHVALSLGFAWLAGSYLWGALLADRPALPAASRPGWLKLGAIETAVIFGALDALFALFVVVQFGHFFGGEGHVRADASLTYAAYARRGFFELVTVAALVVPLLLVAHWLLPRPGRRAHAIFAAVAALLLVLVFVVMVSALDRMRLYQREFGLTELRLYTTAFMAWLAVVLAWFGVTVLRGHRERFTFGAAIGGLAIIAALNLLNPDAFIVRRNAAATRAFDVDYALGLSADAAPALASASRDLPRAQGCRITLALQEHFGRHQDWRTWNWSRARAADIAASQPRCEPSARD